MWPESLFYTRVDGVPIPNDIQSNVSCYDGTRPVQIFCPRCIDLQNQVFQLEDEVRRLKEKLANVK